MMESKQGEPSFRVKVAELEKDLERARDELAKVQKINRSLARQAQRAEQERKRQQETFELICRHGSDVLALVSGEGKIGFLTAPVRTALGFAATELQGRFLQDLCPPEDRDRLATFLLELGKGNGPHSGEFPLTDKHGHVYSFEMHGCVVPHPQTQAPEIMAILRRKLPEETALAPLEDLAASLAHELNQPLTAIALSARACARLARAEKQPARELVPAIESLAVQAERAGELVRRMRQFLAGGRTRRSAADLNSLALEALVQLEPELQSGNIQVRLHLDNSLPHLSVDPIQVNQVIVNLVLNAIEAMQARPAEARHLTLTTSRQEGAVGLAVADTGPGLAPSLGQSLFEPFQTTKPGGMGLGLALSRSLIQAHGGRLWVAESAATGTTFCLSLPLNCEKP
jgi:PAS domain S-box-containing protein